EGKAFEVLRAAEYCLDPARDPAREPATAPSLRLRFLLEKMDLLCQAERHAEAGAGSRPASSRREPITNGIAGACAASKRASLPGSRRTERWSFWPRRAGRWRRREPRSR